MLSAKSIENPTKSNLSNKNIELTHIKCWEVDGKFHIWCESSVTSSGLVLAFCFMVIKWLLQLQSLWPSSSIPIKEKRDKNKKLFHWGLIFSPNRIFIISLWWNWMWHSHINWLRGIGGSNSLYQCWLNQSYLFPPRTEDGILSLRSRGSIYYLNKT